jgi:hypothetical protein
MRGEQVREKVEKTPTEDIKRKGLPRQMLHPTCGKFVSCCLYVLALYTAAARLTLSRSSCLFDRSSHPYRCRIYYQVLTPFPRALHLDPEIELNLVIPSCSLKELRIYVVSVARFNFQFLSPSRGRHGNWLMLVELK